MIDDKKVIKNDLSAPGVLKCVFEHKIESTTVKFKYEGPKINPEEWKQVLSFFQWTYDTTHSESQVRVFLDPVDNKLVFWAFPQEAKTSMSAREIDNDDKKKQRSELPNAGKLIAFGTVHHHCAAGAFQSSTDYSDEKDVTGIHMTIGKMNDPQYNMHARFCHGGFQLEPDLSQFWPIGEIAEMVPPEHWDKVARYQMCKKPDKLDFPDQWKTNLIEVKTVTRYDGGMGYHTYGGVGSSYVSGSGAVQHTEDPWWKRRDDAAVETICDWLELKMDLGEVLALGKFLSTNVAVGRIVTNCRIFNVGLDDVAKEVVLALSREEWLKNQLLRKGWEIDGPVKMNKKLRKRKQLELEASIAAGKDAKGGNGEAKTEASAPTTSTQDKGTKRHWDPALGIWRDDGGNPLPDEEEMGYE